MCGLQQNVKNSERNGNTRPPDLSPEKYAGQEATVRTRNGTTDCPKLGSKLGKEYIKAIYWHPAYLCAEYILWNAGLDEAQAGIKIAGRNINNLRYADDNTLMAETEEKLKSLLIKVRGERKSWLKTQHSKKKSSTFKKLRSWHPVSHSK